MNDNAATGQRNGVSAAAIGVSCDNWYVPFDIIGPLNRDRLRELLDANSVDPRSYSLEGGHGSEKYVLVARPGGWATYYSERGLESGRQEFKTEGQACAYLFDVLTRDLTTQG